MSGFNFEQGTPEWKMARSGKITASRMGEVLSGCTPKSALCILDAQGRIVEKIGNGVAAEKAAAIARARGKIVEERIYEYGGGDIKGYAYELAAEILTGEPAEGADTRAMREGTKREPLARMAYEIRTGDIVSEVGFLLHPVLPYVGASPDGLIFPKRKGLEIKSPGPVKHLKTLMYGMPQEHRFQVQCNLWVTGFDTWDFVSFHPLFKAPHNLFIQTIERDELMIAQMSVMSDELIADVMRIVERFR